jgi:hypothetical protein
MRILILILILCVAAKADDKGTISVNGAAKTQIQPDKAEWTFALAAKAKTIEEAASEAQVAQDRMVSRLSELKIPKDGLVSQGMSQGPVWRQDQDQRIPDGFFSRLSFKLSISDLALYETITTRFFLDNHIEVLRFDESSSKFAEAERKQVVLALADARERAEAIASQLKVHLGHVRFVNSNIVNPVNLNASIVSVFGTNLPSLEPLTVSANIFVTFDIEQ